METEGFSFSDFIRSKILSGFPWNLWVHSWSWFPEVLQILNLCGFRNRFLIKDYQKNIRCLISVLK